MHVRWMLKLNSRGSFAEKRFVEFNNKILLLKQRFLTHRCSAPARALTHATPFRIATEMPFLTGLGHALGMKYLSRQHPGRI